MRWFWIIGLFLLCCGCESNEQTTILEPSTAAPEEKDIGLTKSYYAQPINPEWESVDVKILEVANDTVVGKSGGTTWKYSYQEIGQITLNENRSIHLDLPDSLEMRFVDTIFLIMSTSQSQGLICNVSLSADSSLIAVNVPPFFGANHEICIEGSKIVDDSTVLGLGLLEYSDPVARIRDQLDSFYLKQMILIDTNFLALERMKLTKCSREIVNCRESPFEQLKRSIANDSLNLVLLGEHIRPRNNVRVALDLDQTDTFQDFMSLFSAYTKWLEESRNSLAMLHFNEDYHALWDQFYQGNRHYMERIEAIHSVAPNHLWYHNPFENRP